jgi:hypothetical protein
MIFLRLLGRLILISVGFFLASLAAALTATAGLERAYGLTMATGEPFADYLGHWVLSVMVSTMAIGQFSLTLAAIAIIATETLGLRSWLYYAAAGALMGVLALVALEGAQGAAPSTRLANLEALIFIAAGLSGGLTYWLIAGRSAGALMARFVRAAKTQGKDGPALPDQEGPN